MFNASYKQDGTVVLVGRLDASQVDKASAVLGRVTGPLVVDCHGLDYISSAGISVLLIAMKRLRAAGYPMKLVGVQARILNVFLYSGLDRVFDIESTPS